MHNKRAKGMQIRAKCTHIELNEHSSKYFFSKEKSQSQTKNITCLQIDDNNITTCKDVILEKQRDFYENLYSEKGQDQVNIRNETENFLGKPDIPCLDENEKNTLDSEITMEELTKAVKELPSQKSPGSDGLPSEFYKSFWNKISPLVFKSIQYGIENNNLSHNLIISSLL